MWKLIGKIVLGLFVSVTVALLAFIAISSERKPVGIPSAEADITAKAMLAAINIEAWDTTNYVAWTFFGSHHYLWDKARNLVQVTWKDYKVLLNPNQITGKAWKGNQPVTDKQTHQLVQRAWTYFCNDSFWLNAPAKVFDPNTTRSLVTLKDGRNGLMVNYTAGGVTPGDTYVWLLDEKHRPVAWKMWVKILPIRGLEASWTDWTTLQSGALISQQHKIMGMQQTTITNLVSANNYEALGYADDPFKMLMP